MERIDVLIYKKGLTKSRQKAQELIEDGLVSVNGKIETKPGRKISTDDILEILGDNNPFVSRGGLKLKKAIDLFKINLNQLLCIDVGASTGGFTDCMLSCGADKVYCIDTGENQLSDKLKNDSRVISFEKTNIIDFDIEEKADFISVDVSFVSVLLIIDSIYRLLKDDGYAVILIKPQFEAGKDKIGKKGIVKSIETHKKVLYNIIDILKDKFDILGLTYSPIKGGSGNIEFLLYVKKGGNNIIKIDVDAVVNEASNTLGK